jgi:hypothetical protein
VAALQLWQHNSGRDNLAEATTGAGADEYFAHHVQAVELAAALAQAAGHSCTPEQFCAVTQVRPAIQETSGCLTPHCTTPLSPTSPIRAASFNTGLLRLW